MKKAEKSKNIKKLIFPRCSVCGKTDFTSKRKYRCNSELFAQKEIISCRQCGLAFINPLPGDADLEQYNRAYFKRAHALEGSIEKKSQFHFGIAKIRFQHLLMHQKVSASSLKTVLEIGPGHGFLGKLIADRYPTVEYYVCETDESRHAELKRKGFHLLNSNAEFPKVDLLVLSHVLEHVPNPLEFLSRFSIALRSGGILFLEVPCQDHLHKTIDEPHLNFFDKKSMEILLNKIGFQGIRLSYHGQLIRNLIKPCPIKRVWQVCRTRLLNLGIVAPFSGSELGLEGLSSLERATLKPWKAHRETEEAAWWLRVLATKP